MKLKHVDGMEVDTDKLKDIDALLLEKAEELRQIASKANRVCYIAIDGNGDGGLTNFWNLKSKDKPNSEDYYESINSLFRIMHRFVDASTRGTCGIYPNSMIDKSKLPPSE